MTICAFGELLFDYLDGSYVLGGAPANFISHIATFSKVYDLGLKSYLISAVGGDALGQKAIETLERRGVLTDYVNRQSENTTAMVQVSTNTNGVNVFEIPEHTTFDEISMPAEQLVRQIDYFYMGTLAQRYTPNFLTLTRILEHDKFTAKYVYTDLNLRQDYYHADLIDSLLTYTNCLKINYEELLILKNEIFYSVPIYNHDALLEFVLDHYRLDAILLTLAEKGAVLIEKDLAKTKVDAPAVYPIVDTVGAGDAFSAICVLGTVLGWEYEIFLERGAAFAAEICKVKGAVPDNETWYLQFKDWF